MKVEIEFPDAVLDAIAAAVADRLRPVILGLTASPAEGGDLMSVGELSTYLGGVSRDAIYQKTSKNEIPFVKVGRLLRFRRSEIDRWLAAKSVPDIASLSGPLPPGGRGIGDPAIGGKQSRKHMLTRAVK